MNPPPDAGWTRCQYFGFWDIPRQLVLHHQGRTLLLDSPFEEDLEDYTSNFYVWELEPMEPELTLVATWKEIEERKLRQLDDLPVTALEFWRERERKGGRSYAWYRFKSASS